MDNFNGSNNSNPHNRTPIHNFRPPNPYFQHRPVVDPYASPDGHILNNLNSPYLRYMQPARPFLNSPIAARDHQPVVEYTYHGNNVNRGFENMSIMGLPNQPRPPPVHFGNSPVKADEDVFVMDGVLVKNPAVDRGKSLSSSLIDSSGSSSSGGRNFNRDVCLAYLENPAFCRYGTNCQFVHVNKELRPPPLPYKNTLEIAPCRHYSTSGSCAFGSRCRFLHNETPAKTVTTSTIKQNEPTNTNNNTKIDTIVKLKSTNWSPLDDEIETKTDSGNIPSEEEFDACINNVVSGSRRIKRLPVFNEICPE